MNKVYIVIHNHYDEETDWLDDIIIKVFTSRDLAEDYIKPLNTSNFSIPEYRIEEHELS